MSSNDSSSSHVASSSSSTAHVSWTVHCNLCAVCDAITWKLATLCMHAMSCHFMSCSQLFVTTCVVLAATLHSSRTTVSQWIAMKSAWVMHIYSRLLVQCTHSPRQPSKQRTHTVSAARTLVKHGSNAAAVCSGLAAAAWLCYKIFAA